MIDLREMGVSINADAHFNPFQLDFLRGVYLLDDA